MAEHETERARLARVYSGWSDGGLLELAAESGSLTRVAREALAGELAARGLEAGLGELGNEIQTQDAGRTLSGPLVMVKRFRDLPEAFVARSILDSARIDCFLADENTIRMNWFWSNLLGGLKLIVRPEDCEDAAKLLEESVQPEVETEDWGKPIK